MRNLNVLQKIIKIIKKEISKFLFMIFNIKLTFRRNHLTDHDYLLAKKLILPGDLILVGNFQTLSGLFMGKFFTHSLLYVGGGKCVHANAKGVQKILFDKLFKTNDTLMIKRPKIENNRSEIIINTISFIKKQVGKPYDFYLEHSNDSYFCTNLINESFKRAGFNTGVGIQGEVKQGMLWLIWRIKRVARADDFLKANFEDIYVSKSLQAKSNKQYIKYFRFSLSRLNIPKN